jgi:hypothetical protein
LICRVKLLDTKRNKMAETAFWSFRSYNDNLILPIEWLFFRMSRKAEIKFSQDFDNNFYWKLVS